jgi:peptide/nickel transport system substrate-binding protein
VRTLPGARRPTPASRCPGLRAKAARTALAATLLALAALPDPAAAGLRPAYGGELRVLVGAPPQVADPALATEPADLLLVRAVHATPLELDEQGRLSPGLLEEVPTPEAGGRAFRLRLRGGLRFADGTPLGAADVAASLSRLLAGGAPNAWLALPILGADALLARSAATLAGVQVLSDRELLVTLAFPLPEWPWALATPAAGVVSARGAGAGPFVLLALDAGGAHLAANPLHWRGRPFADRLHLAAADARAAARALARGEADLALRPEAAAPGALATPPLVVTVAVLGRRLGAATEPARQLLAAQDRAELGRLFARGPSAPLSTLVPPALLAQAAPPAPPAPLPSAAIPARLTLVAAADLPDQKAVADRLQVKLFDAGVRAAVEQEPAARLGQRLASDGYDVALLPVAVQPLAPALAAGQVACAARGPAAARRAMAELAGLPPEAAAARAAALTRALDLVPLFATGARASAGPALLGPPPRADGAPSLGDLWRRRGELR